MTYSSYQLTTLSDWLELTKKRKLIYSNKLAKKMDVHPNYKASLLFHALTDRLPSPPCLSIVSSRAATLLDVKLNDPSAAFIVGNATDCLFLLDFVLNKESIVLPFQNLHFYEDFIKYVDPEKKSISFNSLSYANKKRILMASYKPKFFFIREKKIKSNMKLTLFRNYY